MWPALILGADFLCPAGIVEFRDQQESLIFLTQVVKPVKKRKAANKIHRINVIMSYTQEVACVGVNYISGDTHPSGEFYFCVLVCYWKSQNSVSSYIV